MNCTDIHELAPLWHAGELDAGRRAAFDAHLTGCADCAAEIREQEAADSRLRQAVGNEQLNTKALEDRVMRQIGQERRRRSLVAATAVAAAVVAVVIARAHSSTPAPVANPAVFADAARDHTVEVLQQRQRRWRTDPAEIASLEASQGLSDSDVAGLQNKGYKLERAKICRLGSTPYLHMVYAKAGREFSVYMKVRGADTPSTLESSSGNLQLASFSRGRVQAIVVTDAPRGECAEFAKAAQKKP